MSLDDLKRHRDALLLAEVAALLHDIGKLSSQFIDQMSAVPSSLLQDFEHESAITRLRDFVNAQFEDVLKQRALRDKLRLNGISNNEQLGQVLDLILHHDKAKHSAFLVRLLNRCDGSDSGADKGTTRQKGLPQETKQESKNTFIATAFGDETQKIDPPKLDKERVELSINLGRRLGNITSERSSMLEKIKLVYSHSLAETRRSANDVTLWCHSYSVATLYKTSLATFFLTGALDIDNLNWTLLRVNFDVLGLYAKAVKIADLLGYQRAVDEACARVKQLVEEEYPLGNEIYRDSTGIYFTFPDLDLPADLAQEIRRRVEEVEPELAPRIAVTVGDGQTAAEQLKGILAKARRKAIEALKQPFDSENLSACWEQLWKNLPAEYKWEVCPVCRLRPKEEHDEVCSDCEGRRKSRIETWKKQPERTIWVGEVADHNDRVALLVGKFGLDDWLSGDLVQTLLVKAESNNPNGCVPKNPSPARLRRVWETCRRFWEETVCHAILSQNSGANARRKRIVPNKDNWQEGLYNGKVNGKPIDLFWLPDEKVFLTISNLEAAGTFHLTDTVLLERPERKRKGEFQIRDIQDARSPFDIYYNFLSLHTSPDQFLALVPAAAALKIVEKIREEYEKQFGKVRNRLPLFLGLIYAERKMPLLTMIDAARTMLDSGRSTVNSEQWTVKKSEPCSANSQQWTLRFEHGIEWQVPITMGDGQTEDVWYPYFELENQPGTHRNRQFQHDGKTWVHVKDLQKGDVVSITPSRFDFLWLDTAARRFEAGYDNNGSRPTRPTRPFYLEDVERLESIWATFSMLSRTQIYQVLTTIETARERWFGWVKGGKSAENETFKRFIADTLANAEWPKGKAWENLSEPVRMNLIAAAVRGELADLAELHLEILKEKIEKE